MIADMKRREYITLIGGGLLAGGALLATATFAQGIGLTSQPSVFKRAQADGMWRKTRGLPEEMIGRRLSQGEANRLLAKLR